MNGANHTGACAVRYVLFLVWIQAALYQRGVMSYACKLHQQHLFPEVAPDSMSFWLHTLLYIAVALRHCLHGVIMAQVGHQHA